MAQKHRFKGPYTIEGVERALTNVQADLKEYMELIQLKQDLENLKAIMLRVSGNQPASEEAVSKNGKRRNRTEGESTASHAERVMAGQSPMTLRSILVALRNSGWTGSGDDYKDLKRIYVALYRDKERFDQVTKETWRLKSTHK
jgi:hypothetical protein